MDSKPIHQGEKYSIKLDEQYGYYHLYPVPTKEELSHYYDNEFYSPNYSQQINDSSQAVQAEEAEFFRMQHEDILEIIEKEAKGKKLIDIGCGYGNFLKFCQERGFSVFGLDPAADAVGQAQAAGLDVIKADIEDFGELIKEKYDVAVMLNVLEHLRQPHKTLSNVRERVLKDGGLLIVRVPNEFNKLQLIANQEYKLGEWWVSPPQHINYFTVGHLTGLLEKCGFKVFLQEATFPLEMFILFGEQYVGNSKLGKAIHEKRVLFEKTLKKYDNNFKRRLFQIFAQQGIGREITLYAKKQSIT